MADTEEGWKSEERGQRLHLDFCACCLSSESRCHSARACSYATRSDSTIGK